MVRFARNGLFAIGAAAATLFVAVTPAVAQDEILLIVPIRGVNRGAEGTQVEVASANVPAELVGLSCEIFGSTVNQRSVHPGNDLIIVNGDESFMIPNFEDEGDIVHDAGDVETLGPVIRLFVRFGPDGVSSGGFRVSVRNCEEAPPETTVPTTVPEETTTVPEEETTTVPEETTTVPEETTTVPVETTVATTEPEPAGPTTSPTTAAPETTTTTAPPASVSPDPLGPSDSPELPVTGSATWLFVGTGLGLAAAGVALTRTARLRTE